MRYCIKRLQAQLTTCGRNHIPFIERLSPSFNPFVSCFMAHGTSNSALKTSKYEEKNVFNHFQKHWLDVTRKNKRIPLYFHYSLTIKNHFFSSLNVILKLPFFFSFTVWTKSMHESLNILSNIFTRKVRRQVCCGIWIFLTLQKKITCK